MTWTLNPDAKARLSQEESIATLWQDDAGDTVLLAKAADEHVVTFGQADLIQTHWGLWRFPCASLLKFQVVICDRPNDPYRYEMFVDVAESVQLEALLGLLTQETLALHAFDSQAEYVSSLVTDVAREERLRLAALVVQAIEHRQKLQGGWRFERAVAAFQMCQPY